MLKIKVHETLIQFYKDSDCDSDEEECICQPLTIPVLYVNMRSINPNNEKLSEKKKRLQELIKAKNPAIIAIVETWLNETHPNDKVAKDLGIIGYTIWRRDRCDGHPLNNAYRQTTTSVEELRGGGILIAWKNIIMNNENALVLELNPSEDYGDAIMSADIFVKLNCNICNETRVNDVFGIPGKFGFTVVYRRPVPYGKYMSQYIGDVMSYS